MSHQTTTTKPTVHRTIRQAHLSLKFLCITGLVTDAIIHLILASDYDRIGQTLTEGTLFRIESTIALLAAFTLLITTHRAATTIALLVALTALTAVLASVYWQLGPIGPLPDTYEPIWFGTKRLAATAEGTAAAAAALLLLRPIAHATRHAGTTAKGPAPARFR